MTKRPTTTIDEIADAFVDTTARLSPISATYAGIPGYDDQLDDFSPAGHGARADAARAALAQLDQVTPVDDIDKITVAAMQERLGLDLELFEAEEQLRDLNVIASPLQEVRQVFDLTATATQADWENIAARLTAVPQALAGYQESLELGRSKGLLPAQRQIERGVMQATELAGADSFFTSFVGSAPELPEALTAKLAEGAAAAQAAYGELATFLQDLHGQAPVADAVGRERYARFSRVFLGAKIDLDETYEWGLEELARITAEQEEVARKLGANSIEAAIELLDADPARQLAGPDALQQWMQRTSDAAIAALADVHFDIPEPVKTLECCIAPTNTGAIYYTGPSEDFSRPGRMWWSVPDGVDSFTTWRETTTVYHEGVPGHHLQVAQTVYRRELLNRWRRLACWVSGTGEGWALYAERLMAELGFLDDLGDQLGMLDGQRLRAARVALDLGVHLGKSHPDGGTWNAENAWDFLRRNVNMSDEFVAFELDRYLGWPGQAPAYKIGQRLWEQIRDEALAKGGGLKAFHRRALDIGCVGLDTLREALL